MMFQVLNIIISIDMLCGDSTLKAIFLLRHLLLKSAQASLDKPQNKLKTFKLFYEKIINKQKIYSPGFVSVMIDLTKIMLLKQYIIKFITRFL